MRIVFKGQACEQVDIAWDEGSREIIFSGCYHRGLAPSHRIPLREFLDSIGVSYQSICQAYDIIVGFELRKDDTKQKRKKVKDSESHLPD